MCIRDSTKRKHTKRKHSGGIDGPIVLLKPVRETFRTLFDKTPKKGYYIPYYVGINDYLEKSSVDDLNKDLYSKDLAKFQDKRDRVWNEFTVSINLLEYMRHLAIYLQRKQYIIQCTLFFKDEYKEPIVVYPNAAASSNEEAEKEAEKEAAAAGRSSMYDTYLSLIHI